MYFSNRRAVSRDVNPGAWTAGVSPRIMDRNVAGVSVVGPSRGPGFQRAGLAGRNKMSVADDATDVATPVLAVCKLANERYPGVSVLRRARAL